MDFSELHERDVSAIAAGVNLGVAMVVVVFVAVVYMVTNHSFGARCKEAGYTGPAFEECVDRLKEGGKL